jgi:hypothetical protein
MHGQYIVSIDRQLICDEETFLWESRRELRADTESKKNHHRIMQQKYYEQKQIANVHCAYNLMRQ